VHTLTNSEVQALESILDVAVVKSKEEDDGDPVFHDVSVDAVNPFADRHAQLNVYNSLAMKGLVECSMSLDEHDNEVLEFVCITPEGLQALQSAKGMH